MRTTHVDPSVVSRAVTRARGQLRRTALSVLLACGMALATTVTSQAQQPGEKNAGQKNAGQKTRSAVRKDNRQTARRKSASAAERKRQSAQRDRWSSLSAQKRKQLEAIYDQLKKLPADKRKLLLDRLRGLDSDTRRERIRAAKKRLENDEAWFERQSRLTRRAVLERLPKKERERLQKLPAKERQKHLQKYVATRRAKLIEKLPADVAAEVRKLPPGKQAQRLKQYRTSQVFRRTFQDRNEINRLRKLPNKELRRLLAVNGTGDSAASKPDYLSARTWKRWKALKRYERERILRRVRTGGDLGTGRPTQERTRTERARTGARPESRSKDAGPRKTGRNETRRGPAQRAPSRRPPTRKGSSK